MAEGSYTNEEQSRPNKVQESNRTSDSPNWEIDQDLHVVFGGFEGENFYFTPGWRAVSRILTSDTGAYALTGERGAGKTWCMLRATEEADARGGIGLWFPSPSEYDSSAFILALTENFALKVERQLTPRRLLQAYQSLLILVLSAITLLGCSLLFFTPSGRDALGAASWGHIALAVFVVLAGNVFYSSLRKLRRSTNPRFSLYLDAKEMQEAVRYTARITQSSQRSLEGTSGTWGKFSISRVLGRELSERPATLSALTHRFRRFARDVAEGLDESIVISIDELDKLYDLDQLRALLRDIKGLFDILGVHFFVSISVEAARVLKLGPIRERDEFSSSFYTVVEFAPLSTVDGVGLLEQRSGTSNRGLAAMVAILSGGNPREIVRLADLVRTGLNNPSHTDGTADAIKLLRADICRLFHEQHLMNSNAESRSATAIEALSDALPRLASGDRQIQGLTDNVWTLADPADVDDTWSLDTSDTELSESWHRLLVRLYVMEQVASVDFEWLDTGDRLQAAIRLSSRSSTAAIRVLRDSAYAELLISDTPLSDTRPASDPDDLPSTGALRARRNAENHQRGRRRRSIGSIRPLPTDNSRSPVTRSREDHRRLPPRIDDSNRSSPRRWILVLGSSFAAILTIIAVIVAANGYTENRSPSNNSLGDEDPTAPSRTVYSTGSEPSALLEAFGKLWVVNSGSNSVDVMSGSPSGSNRVPVGDTPRKGLGATSSHVVVANDLDNTVTLISPDAERVVETLPLDHPAAVVQTGDDVWFSSKDPAQLTKLPGGSIAFSTRVTLSSDNVLLASDGATIWVLDSETGRLEPRSADTGEISGSATTLQRDADDKDLPFTTLLFAEGALWANTDHHLYRVNIRSLFVTDSITPEDSFSQPSVASTTSFDGAVWAISGGRDLMKVDPDTQAVESVFSLSEMDSIDLAIGLESQFCVIEAEARKVSCFTKAQLDLENEGS